MLCNVPYKNEQLGYDARGLTTTTTCNILLSGVDHFGPDSGETNDWTGIPQQWVVQEAFVDDFYIVVCDKSSGVKEREMC